MQIVGEAVVLDDAPVLHLVEAHNGKVAVIFEFRSLLDLLLLFVAVTFLLEHFCWDA
jgi:hypothetical protein